VTIVNGSLVIRKEGPNRWSFMSPMLATLDNGRLIEIETGFTCDFGSIPDPFRVIVPPLGSVSDVAWGFHDKLYKMSREGDRNWTRAEADDAMLELLLYLGTPEHIAWGAWTAVRAGAGSTWGVSRPTPHPDPYDEFLDQ
jgi:hypothetical protein